MIVNQLNISSSELNRENKMCVPNTISVGSKLLKSLQLEAEKMNFRVCNFTKLSSQTNEKLFDPEVFNERAGFNYRRRNKAVFTRENTFLAAKV